MGRRYPRGICRSKPKGLNRETALRGRITRLKELCNAVGDWDKLSRLDAAELCHLVDNGQIGHVLESKDRLISRTFFIEGIDGVERPWVPPKKKGKKRKRPLKGTETEGERMAREHLESPEQKEKTLRIVVTNKAIRGEIPCTVEAMEAEIQRLMS